jgi:L-ascorbate metabolism protein UlaG (beta-lactamase superfamily)
MHMTLAPKRRIASVALLGAVITGAASANPYFDPSRAHHRADGFVNNYGPPGGKPLSDLLKWFHERSSNGLPRAPSTHVDGYAFPVIRPDLDFLRANRDEVSVTWIGHSTLFLQLGGLNILTDPHFSARAFMVQFAGPQRMGTLPVRLDELPRVDLVLISHNHYDHLDLDTVLALCAQPGGSPLFVAPLGVDLWLRAQGIERVERFDWWEEKRLLGMDVHFVPAQHWSSRTPWDRNSTLWGGWVLKTADFSFYFAGDTGYSKDFEDIGARFGGFDLAAIPVGGYLPRWFMKEQHVNPEEAVRIHLDVKARRSIGIHWGTFELTDEPLDEPIGELPAARRAHGVPAEDFVLFRHGETRVYSRSAP